MKDSTYTLRLNSGLKEAVKIAAKKDHRSIASLLEKIIIDYLQKEKIKVEYIEITNPDGANKQMAPHINLA